MDDFGENIWDISSWTSDINWKDWHLHHYFDSLSFIDCVHNILDLAETYFQSVFNNYNRNLAEDDEDEDTVYVFPYLDILVLLTEEYLFGFYFQGVPALLELRMLEIICRYFQESKLDTVRYFVFDCLFGIPRENLQLQEGLLEHKMTVMCKLTSLAVGLKCANVLNCVAVWLYTYGSHYDRGNKVALSIINDYCYICPNAITSVKDLLNVSPVFANQFARTCGMCYRDNEKDGESPLPPVKLVEIIATWILEQPKFAMIKIPAVFLNLPSIHKYSFYHAQKSFRLCGMLSHFKYCLLEPFLRKKQLEVIAGKNNEENKRKIVFSKLHFALLNFIGSLKKVTPLKMETDSDEEEGELLEENDGIELLSSSDCIFLLKSLTTYLLRYEDVDAEIREESIDRLVQVIQVARSSACLDLPPRELKGILLDLPKTRLVEQVLSTI